MSNPYFEFKQFRITQVHSAMKVTTDACLFGAWAAESIQFLTIKNKIQNILDVGTGTGLLSLMIIQKNPEVFVDAVEIDHASAIEAHENTFTSSWKKNIKVIEADIKTFVPGSLYDVIISNPPFYENELASPDAKKNVAYHDEGLLLEELLVVINKNLNGNGKFFLLSSNKRDKELNKLFTKYNLFISEKVSVRQSVNHPISRVMICGSANGDEKTKISEISIRDDKEQYTTEFTKLLKDYYLNL